MRRPIFGIVLALQLELADRVFLERVDAERDDHDIRRVGSDFPAAVLERRAPLLPAVPNGRG